MNTGLFQTQRGRMLPATDTTNNAGGKAYKCSDEHALAQYAFTGTFAQTYYVGAEVQLEEAHKLCQKVSPEFVAKLAVAAREGGYMKDMPCFLLAHLASLKTPEAQVLLGKVFPRAIDNARMLRTFVQIVRSGVTGRKSFGSAIKRLILNWLESRRDDSLFRDQVGESPSLADIIKMVHPKATRPERDALYGYLIGKDVPRDKLPKLVQHYEAFKSGDKAQGVPDVPFQMLTSLSINTDEWADIFRRAPWHMTRMNLNTALRHGVFTVPGMTKLIADRLRDREAIQKAKVLPYQLLVAYKHIDEGVPHEVKEALQDAMEIAIENVPTLGEDVIICTDVSGSMSWASVTGERKGSTSKVRCIDVAALVSAAMLRVNRSARVIPFEGEVVLYEKPSGSYDQTKPLRLNPRDSVMTNVLKLSAIGGGSTNVSAPLALLNKEQAQVGTVIVVSDNASWVDSGGAYLSSKGTATMQEWERIKRRCPKAKLVCIDITPNPSTQAIERDDILNVGGWSDQVFDVIAAFAQGTLGPQHWVGQIQAVAL